MICKLLPSAAILQTRSVMSTRSIFRRCQIKILLSSSAEAHKV
jgi:hypothetical protein